MKKRKKMKGKRVTGRTESRKKGYKTGRTIGRAKRSRKRQQKEAEEGSNKHASKNSKTAAYTLLHVADDDGHSVRVPALRFEWLSHLQSLNASA